MLIASDKSCNKFVNDLQSRDVDAVAYLMDVFLGTSFFDNIYMCIPLFYCWNIEGAFVFNRAGNYKINITLRNFFDK